MSEHWRIDVVVTVPNADHPAYRNPRKFADAINRYLDGIDGGGRVRGVTAIDTSTGLTSTAGGTDE